MPLPLIVPALGALAGATGLSANYGLDPSKWLKKGGDLITNTWDKFKNGNVNEVNKQIADQNLQFQYDNLEYQKALQQQIFDREDTAYERTITDMRNAGLNPMMMTGTNGAGEAISTEAPQNNYQKLSSGMAEIIPYILDMANKKQDFDIGKSLQSKTEAEASSAQTEAQINLATAMDKISNSHMENKTKGFLLQDLARNMEFNSSFGIFNGMADNDRIAKMISESNYDYDNLQPKLEWNESKQDYETKWTGQKMTRAYKEALDDFVTEMLGNIMSEKIGKTPFVGGILSAGTESAGTRLFKKKK